MYNVIIPVLCKINPPQNVCKSVLVEFLLSTLYLSYKAKLMCNVIITVLCTNPPPEWLSVLYL